MRIDTEHLRRVSISVPLVWSGPKGRVIEDTADELDRLYAIEDILEEMVGDKGWLPKPYRDHVNAKLAAIGAASDKD